MGVFLPVPPRPRESSEPTGFAVICPEHGRVFLSEEEYDRQLSRPDSTWKCPRCGKASEWDEDNYDAWIEQGGTP